MVFVVSSSVHGAFHSHQEEGCLKTLDGEFQPLEDHQEAGSAQTPPTAAAASTAQKLLLLRLPDHIMRQRGRLSNTTTCCVQSESFNMEGQTHGHQGHEEMDLTQEKKKTDHKHLTGS